MSASTSPHDTGGLPAEFSTRRLVRRLAEVLALLVVIGLIALLTPGLGEVRDRFADAAPGWIALGVVLELFSCLSYVLLFRGVFCPRMSWRTSSEIGWAELGVGSIVPASGAGGLALGAWILHRRGMPADRIARRSVAFFIIKSSVNFVAVVVVGFVMAVGVGPHHTLLLTALPAAMSLLVIVLVLLIPRLGPGQDPSPDATRAQRIWSSVRRAVIHGTAEAIEVVRQHDIGVIVGAIGYWIFDNAVLWAMFHAVGVDVPITIVLMGYLIGQLGGLLPLPGGIGGIDGGLLGTFVVYGVAAAPATAAVLGYRLILFWLPLIGGVIAFLSLRKALRTSERAELAHRQQPAPVP